MSKVLIYLLTPMNVPDVLSLVPSDFFDDQLFVRGLNAASLFEMVPDVTKRCMSTTK
jgi:hypothetical protein